MEVKSTAYSQKKEENSSVLYVSSFVRKEELKLDT